MPEVYMKRILRIAALLVAFGFTGHGLWASAQREAVLGANGELFTVKSGTYGELFPGQKNIEASNPVLALDIEKPDATKTRLLVKGTEGTDVDSAPFLLYEEASSTLFLVWEIRLGGVFPVLMLSGYKDSWLDPYAIIDYPFALKTSPQLAVTHDTYREDGSSAEATPVTKHRTILHLLWSQEGDDGAVGTYYTPIFLENGRFLGRSPSYNLDSFGTAETAFAGQATTLAAQLTKVQRGRDERTVMVAFASAGRLLTLEIGALPPQLGRIADGARSHIIDFGARLYPSGLSSLAAEARAEVIRLGASSFDPEVLQSLANQIQTYVATASPKTPLKLIADGARSHIIDFGARLSGRGMRNTQAASSSLVEVDPSALEMADGEGSSLPSQILQMGRISSWPAPETGMNAQIFVSENGERTIICWAEAKRVVYRESNESGWTGPLELRLSDNVSLTRAYEILEQRVRNH
jgi:hypothetical protein